MSYDPTRYLPTYASMEGEWNYEFSLAHVRLYPDYRNILLTTACLTGCFIIGLIAGVVRTLGHRPLQKGKQS